VTEPIGPELEAVISIHERQIAEHGASSGLRDGALLESAPAGPRHLYAYGEPPVFEMAAACGAGIVKNHPFPDGNKRTGFMAAYTFLGCNGWRLGATQVDVVRTVLALHSSEITEQPFAPGLEQNSQPRH
jgi:death-on-curing protein